MSHVTRRGPVKPSLNITPLIDVVFLLIVFFMIVNNIVTDEVPELQLPDLIDPQTSQVDGEGRVIVNIIPMQPYEPDKNAGQKVGPGNEEKQVLARDGEVKAVSIGKNKWVLDPRDPEQLAENIKAFEAFAAQSIAARHKKNGEPPLILLRADAGVYYGRVLPIMNTLQQAMVEALGPDLAAETPIQLVAYMPD